MITLKNCAWPQESKALFQEDGMLVSRERILAARRYVDQKFKHAAERLLVIHRRDIWLFKSTSACDLRRSPSRVRGVVIKPPAEGGSYYFLLTAEKTPGIYTYQSTEASPYDYYPGDLGAACLSILLQEGWKVVTGEYSMPGDPFGSGRDNSLDFMLESANEGSLSNEQYLEWASSIGRWPELNSQILVDEGSKKLSSRRAVHSFDQAIDIEDCRWKPYSRLRATGDSMRVTDANLDWLDQVVEDRHRYQAARILCFGRPLIETTMPVRRLYWVKRGAVMSRGKD